MSPEGWIFVFGFRLLDVGLLIVWLVWFFRLRDDGEEPPDEGGGGGEGPEPKPPAGPGGGDLPLPTGRVPSGDRRRRDGHRPSRTPRHRRNAPPPLPTPMPARVRSPSEAPSRIRR